MTLAKVRPAMAAGTIGEHLDANRGVGPGFGTLRLILASGVVLWHCFPITTGSPVLIEATPLWFLVSSMVPMFFALSGFLVIASADRLPAKSFLMNRAARIFPALLLVILATSFLLGPAVTTEPLSQYFSSRRLLRYLMGAFGLISFDLPGVFETNPASGNVNGSLWTVPHELLCYAIVAGLIVLGLARKWWMLVIILLSFFAGALLVEITSEGDLPRWIERILRSVHFSQGAKIIPFFMFGALAHILRHRIPMRNWLALGSLLVVLAVGGVFDATVRKHAIFWLLAGPPLTYLTVWAGMVPIPELPLLKGKDISYGVYLWHFPILQTIVLVTGIARWWLLGLVGIIPVLLVAVLSWNHVESPVLSWRKRAVASYRARTAKQHADA